ncbi:MAG TPA: flagellar basal-body MS-ring/collar protein FliF [Acidothermaceae bacterium]|jgi:flagellar M-ring protein FliF|nr:flagellar basal-body MS-ring/collar protein FliF [Acidothermaceae bacterium]
MNFDFKRILDRGRAVYGEFTAGQKTITALVVVGLIVGAYLFSGWASKPTYTPLFSNLAASDASAITDKLTASKEPYKLADGGATILVPQKDVYQLRLDMAKANLPTGGVSGFSLLDKGGITTSQFQQNVEYQQAIEGELVKTIEAIDGVSAAVVHVVLPDNDVFSSDSSKPTASVLVTTDPSKPLGAGQVQAIVHLVASSIEGLDPNDVTVADSHGNVLSAPGVSGVSGTTGFQDQQTSAYEQRVSSAVQSLLEPLVGAGHVIVQTNATLNFDSQETTSENYVQPSPGTTPIPLSETKSSEVYSGTAPNATGILGPDNIAVPTPSGTASPGTYASNSSTVDNAIGRVVQQVKTAPGAVQHLSVAVLLDSATAAKVNAADVQKLVENAAGVQTSRGDSVQVSTMPFDQTQAEAAKKDLAAAAKSKDMNKLISYGKDGLIGFLVLGAVVFFMRKAKKAQERSPVLSTSERLELEEARKMRALLAAQKDEVVRELVPGPSGQDRLELGRPSIDSEIGELVERQPEEVAQLLRGWLADRRPS